MRGAAASICRYGLASGFVMLPRIGACWTVCNNLRHYSQRSSKQSACTTETLAAIIVYSDRLCANDQLLSALM
jgi:hypothetical protein